VISDQRSRSYSPVIARSPKGDEAIQEASCAALDCFASLAMTRKFMAGADHPSHVEGRHILNQFAPMAPTAC
jgi:hypothetical protein